MDYDELLPEWDRDDLSRRAALDSRLAEMVMQHLADDPMWARTVTSLAEDLVEHDEVLAMLHRFCTVIENQAIYMYGGSQEALDHMRHDLAQLRRIAMKGATQS